MNGVRVIRLGQRRYRGRSRVGYAAAYGLFFLRCLVMAAQLQVRERYRVVHVHNMPDVLVFAAIVPRLAGAGVMLDIHDPMPETMVAKYAGTASRSLYRVLVWLERLSVWFATKTVTVNHPVRDGVLLGHGYSRGEIDVIANFADDRLFTPVPYRPPTDKVRFVFHGTILERYGLGTLVEAVRLAKHQGKFEVRIIGEGDYSQSLKDQISSKRVGHVVRFDNRVFPLREIPALLADCHVGLVPLDVTPVSDFALPLKLVEYTCLGLPSITVQSTAIAYYLRPEESFTYPPGDAIALAGLLDRIAESPDCLAGIRECLPRARARMSWTLEKKRYVAMLDEMSGREPASCTVGHYSDDRT